MEITYKTRKIEKVCTIASEAEKKYGSEMAEKIHQRIDEIDASDTVEEMVQFHIGRCHPLKGNQKSQSIRNGFSTSLPTGFRKNRE